MPGFLIVVAVLIVGGAVLMLRDSSSPSTPVAPPGALDEVRTRVVAHLRERLAGWEVAPDVDSPAKLTIRHESANRRIEVDVGELAGRWDALIQRGEPEQAEELISRFVDALTSDGNEEQAGSFDVETARLGLALQLVRDTDAPQRALHKRAGPLTAVLVLRNPSGPEPLGEADVAELGLSPDAAFDVALSNHSHDVEDGPFVDIAAGTASEPLVLEIGTGDPLAASLALTREARDLAREKLRAEPLFLIATSGRFYAVAPTAEALDSVRQLAGSEPLLAEPVSPEALALHG